MACRSHFLFGNLDAVRTGFAKSRTTACSSALGVAKPKKIDFPPILHYPSLSMLVRIIKTVLSALSASGLGIFLV
jgi:hypothetical protein